MTYIDGFIIPVPEGKKGSEMADGKRMAFGGFRTIVNVRKG